MIQPPTSPTPPPSPGLVADSARRTLLIFVLLAVSCATSHRRPERDKPPENPSIVAIRDLLKEFNEDIVGKDFEDAEKRLKDLESCIKKADVATITHRDYPDLSAQVRAARSGLATAKRDSIIAQLVDDTKAQLALADKVLEEIGEKGPSDDRLDALEDIVKRLRGLVEDGRPQRKISPYSELAPELDKKMVVFVERDLKHRWQLDASDAIQSTIKNVAGPPPELQPDQDLDDSIDRYDDIRSAYGKCREAAAKWARHKDFEGGLKLNTALGALTMEDTASACEAREKVADERHKKLKWMTEVQDAIKRVRRATDDLTDAKTPTLKLETNERVAPLFKECEERLNRTEEKTGFDAKIVFTTKLGKLTATKLREACGAEGRRVLAERPTLRWRIAVEQGAAELEEARREVKSASSETDQAGKVEPLKAAIKGFDACVEHADLLAALKDDRWREAKPEKSELQSVKDLSATCRKERESAVKLLAAVQAALAPAKPKAEEKKPDTKKPSSDKRSGKGSHKPKKH